MLPGEKDLRALLGDICGRKPEWFSNAKSLAEQEIDQLDVAECAIELESRLNIELFFLDDFPLHLTFHDLATAVARKLTNSQIS